MLVRAARVITIFCILCLAGCATLSPNFDEPEVTVSAFRVLPSNGLPKFEIELHVINPNGIELKLRGISYTASIEGHKVLSGVANNIPVIAAYGEGAVNLSGGIDLFGSFQLITGLMQQRNTGMNYTLDVKLDVGRFMPAIRIQKKGEIIAPAN
jgi:LEA14-like dessication related protein